LQNHATDEGLDQLKVLKMLPNDFPVSDLTQYNLLSFLKTVFDYKLTVKENVDIGKNLASVENINNKVGLHEKKKAHV